MTSEDVVWKKYSLYFNSYLISTISLLIFDSILILLLMYIKKHIFTISEIMIISVTTVALIWIIGYVIRSDSPKFYTITENSILLQYKKDQKEYNWDEISFIKYSRPWNIEIHLKTGKKDGMLLKSYEINDILNVAKENGVNIK
jgi:MFS superfamily sulfate permease-like transporter